MADSITDAGGTTVSFSNTPQAKDDYLSLGGLTGVQYLNVLANDSGGNAKILYSIDDACSDPISGLKTFAPEDLLTKDASYVDAAAAAASTDTSKLGAQIWITTTGQIAYDASSISGFIAAIPGGETRVDEITYAIQLGNGTLSWAKAYVTITGVNDAPTITSDGGAATASVNVGENTTAVTDVNATDPDAGATLIYSIVNTAGTDFAKFTIDASTGVLSFISAPNFKSPADVGGTDGDNAYVVDVQVSDGSLTDTQTITVNVQDVNAAPTITAPNGGAATASVNVDENTTAVTDVDATDDGENTNTLIYSIVNTAGTDLPSSRLMRAPEFCRSSRRPTLRARPMLAGRMATTRMWWTFRSPTGR